MSKTGLRVLRGFILFVPIFLFAKDSLIKELCEKKDRMSEFMKNYRVIADAEVSVYDEDDNLIRNERRKVDLFWDGNKWSEKSGKGILRTNEKFLTPFKESDISFYQFEIKDSDENWIIEAKLYEKYRNLKGEEGKYIVSKKTGYFEKTYTTQSKLSSDLEDLEIETEYGEIEKEVIAPVKIKIRMNIYQKEYEIRVKTISILNLTYKKN
jgi:hypothetical protein